MGRTERLRIPRTSTERCETRSDLGSGHERALAHLIDPDRSETVRKKRDAPAVDDVRIFEAASPFDGDDLAARAAHRLAEDLRAGDV